MSNQSSKQLTHLKKSNFKKITTRLPWGYKIFIKKKIIFLFFIFEKIIWGWLGLQGAEGIHHRPGNLIVTSRSRSARVRLVKKTEVLSTFTRANLLTQYKPPMILGGLNVVFLNIFLWSWGVWMFFLFKLKIFFVWMQKTELTHFWNLNLKKCNIILIYKKYSWLKKLPMKLLN